jgi:tetratricopeptide (TPR) repeat protein
MKKIVILLFATILSTGYVFAQKKNVVSAFNYLRKDKLDKAKEAIDPAIENDKTMGDPKTWFYYGNIYLSIHLTEEEEYSNLDDNALDKAYNAYLRALKLDDKDQYAADVKDRLQVCAEQYFNKGVNAYNDQSYEKSANSFARSAEVNSTLGHTDSSAILYAGQSAYFGELFEEATKYFNMLLSYDYQDPSVYRMLSDIYKRSGDTTAATTVLLEGRKVFPNDYNLIVDAANIYLATGQNQDALDVLNLAIEKDDTNATLFFAAGTIHDKMKKYDKAADMYLKAIEIDPEFFDANYNLGALYYNQAAEKILEADQLPLSAAEEYEALNSEAQKMMKKALPYLEKADSIQTADAITLQTLKEIYTRLNMMEKLKGINERLDK